MKRINVIPYPRSVVFTGGSVPKETLEKVEYKEDKALGEEAYLLTVSPDGVVVTSAGDKGRFYAQCTLRQLKNSDEIPCVSIDDGPAFPYRGFMVDTVRHMVSLEDTRRLIDAMSMFKMNYMHWHISDDQGFRIKLDSHSELTEKSSVRKASLFGNENDHTPYGGYYTKDEVKSIIDYAAEHFIEVIPEIDMPGHTSAILHAKPELSCKGSGIEIVLKQGVFPEIMCAGKEETFEFIKDILDELTELFPCRYFHIGGDEAPKTRWKECSDCQAKMKELGLKNEEQLQGYFVNRVREYLEEKGREAIVWNESLNSGLVKNVTVQRWMDSKGLSEKYANAGGKVIMSDYYHYYCDYPYAMTPLKKTYDYSPLTKKLDDCGRKNIIGVETPLWTEYVRNTQRLMYMAFPRFAAVAESGWTPEYAKDEKDFERRFGLITPVLQGMGIVPAPACDWNPSVKGRLNGVIKFFAPVAKNM